MPLKVSILNWTGDRDNWGCQATSQGLLQDLREAARGQELAIHTVPLGQMSNRDRRIRLLQPLLRQWLSGRVASSRLFERLAALTHGEDVYRAAEADLVVFMAEGTMSGRRFFEADRLLMLPYLMANRFRKPVLSLNQTIYSARREFEPAIRNVYRSFDLTAVREPASLRYARRVGLEKAVLIPDSAFRAMSNDRPLRELVTRTPDAPLVCLTASGGFSQSSFEAYVGATFEWAAKHGMQVCLLTWQPGVLASLGASAERRGGHPPLAPAQGLGYEDVSALLAQSLALVGGRYHTAIQAAAVGTPFVMVPSGTHKTQGLLDLLEYPLPERSFDDVDGVQADLSRIDEGRQQLSDHLRRRVGEVNALRREGIQLLARAFEAVAAGQSVRASIESAPEFARLRFE